MMVGTPEELSKYLWSLDKTKKYEIKEYKEKRTLNSNAYLWKLVTEIGNALNKSKEEIYLQMLKDYGQSMLIPVPKGTIPSRITKYYEFECSSQLNGKDADWYKCYIGSSNYDTREINILLNGVVQEAKNLGIKTKEDYELEKLIEEWER